MVKQKDTKSIRSRLDFNSPLPAGEEEPQYRVLHEELSDGDSEPLLCWYRDCEHHPSLWLSVAHEAPRCTG